MMGYPAVRMEQNIETYKALRRLPRLMERFRKLERLIANNEDKS